MLGWLIIAIFVGLLVVFVVPMLRGRKRYALPNDLRRADEAEQQEMPDQSKITDTVEGMITSRWWK